MLSTLGIKERIKQRQYRDKRWACNDEDVYWMCFNLIEEHFIKLWDDVYKGQGSLKYPIDIQPILDYLHPIEFRFIPFDKFEVNSPDIEGKWVRDINNPKLVLIYYNTAGSSDSRQKFTKLHELVHFMQSADGEFLDFYDDLIIDKVLPPEMCGRLLERVTDRAVANYMMPRSYVERLFNYIKEKKGEFTLEHLNLLTEHLGASRMAVDLRLRECGLIRSSLLH